MSKGIWVSPTKFVSFAEISSSSLQHELASRSAAYDFSPLFGLLPDPDPVLRKRGDGVEILEELTADGHLLSVMQQRRIGTLKKEFRFEPGSGPDGEVSSQAEQLAQDFNRDFSELKSRDLVSAILNAPYYGMTPVELTFAPGDGRLRLARAAAKPVRWFGFDDENEPRFRSLANPEEGEELPWGKFVFARHFPEYDNPYGIRLLSRCFWPITFKKGGLKFWVTFMEKYGMPFLIGHYAKGTSPDEQQDMLTKLVAMVRNAVAVVPDGDKVEMLGGGSTTGSGYMVFDRMKSAMDAEVSKVIIGQTLTSEAGDKGSYSLGKVHGDVLADLQDGDQTMCKNTLDEIARIFARVNAADVDPPVCKFFEEEDPQKDFADRDKVLEESGRLRLKKAYYIRRYGFKEDDFDLVESVTATATPEQAAGNFSEQAGPFEYSASAQQDAAEQAQQELDAQADELTRQGVDIYGKWKSVVRQWLSGEEELRHALMTVTTLFEQLKTDDLQASLLTGLLTGERLGRESVPSTADHAETVWGAGKLFTAALDFFKAKSFSVAGVARADLIAAIKDELTRAMAEGVSSKDFRLALDDLFARNGLDPLASHHIDTIYRTNMQTAFQAGRYQQLSKPHILKARPYWKYVAIRDGVTRPAHREMHGKIFHHTNPIWRVWYPPNGFNCRCQVVSLSQREVDRDGLYVDESDPSGKSFESLDTDTGVLTRHVLLPDTGWGGDSGGLERMLNAQQNRDGGPGGVQVWREKKDQPGPADLGRPVKGDIPDKDWLSVVKGPSLERLMADMAIDRREALELIEADYRKAMGIAPLESQSVLRSRDGETIIVTLQALAHAMMKRDDARERFIPYLRQTLEDPYEIILTEYKTPAGKTKFRKKYIGLFRDDKQEAVIVVAEIGQDGAVVWNIMNTKKKAIDGHRSGVRLIYGR